VDGHYAILRFESTDKDKNGNYYLRDLGDPSNPRYVGVDPASLRVDQRFASPAYPYRNASPNCYDNPANPYITFSSDWSGTSKTYSNPNFPGRTQPNTNFIEGTIKNYLETGYKTANIADKDAPNQTGIRMAVGKIKPSLSGLSSGYILYMYFSAFALNNNAHDAGLKNLAGTGDYFNDLRLSADCRGIIFDIRGNGGGYNADIVSLLAPFLDKNLTFAYTRGKKGEGRLDYLPWVPYYIQPAPVSSGLRKEGNLDVPIVAIVNDNAVSCGEIFSIAIRAMKNGRLVGTQTWGGTGPHMGDKTPAYTNDGCFGHNKAWVQVYETGFELRDRNMQSYEGKGLTPDDVVSFDKTDFDSGTDAQLEKAIYDCKQYIANGHY
jgi:hypothetical protein